MCSHSWKKQLKMRYAFIQRGLSACSSGAPLRWALHRCESCGDAVRLTNPQEFGLHRASCASAGGPLLLLAPVHEHLAVVRLQQGMQCRGGVSARGQQSPLKRANGMTSTCTVAPPLHSKQQHVCGAPQGQNIKVISSRCTCREDLNPVAIRVLHERDVAAYGGQRKAKENKDDAA